MSDLHESVRLYAYYGHAFGQGIVRSAFATDQLNYGYVEATVRF